MEKTIKLQGLEGLYRNYVGVIGALGIMEKKMEATIVCWVYSGYGGQHTTPYLEAAHEGCV